MNDDACVKNIWSCLDIPRAMVSQHLAIPKNKGFVMARTEGVVVSYSIRDPKVRMVTVALDEETHLMY